MTDDQQPKKEDEANYIRNFIFGTEDSLVSTAGMLSGITAAELSKGTIFLVGVIMILVSAFSMSAGSILSDNSAREYLKGTNIPLKHSGKAGMVMFFSYSLMGSIPLFPYILFDPLLALPVSILLSLVSLFIIGLIGGRLSQTNRLRNAVEMSLIGGLAIILGVTTGHVFSNIPGF